MTHTNKNQAGKKKKKLFFFISPYENADVLYLIKNSLQNANNNIWFRHKNDNFLYPVN